MQNASTAAATATEARATDDAESHVIFLLPPPLGTHLSDIKGSVVAVPVQSAVVNIDHVPAPLLTQAVGLTDDVCDNLLQAFKATTLGFGSCVVEAAGVAQAASV
jgi:hypothetical protein